jgi:hypothetical protein
MFGCLCLFGKVFVHDGMGVAMVSGGSREPILWPVLLMMLSVPMILGLVPRNWFYGVRTPRTMA